MSSKAWAFWQEAKNSHSRLLRATAKQFASRFEYRSHIAPLCAFRTLCKNKLSTQYVEDIDTIGAIGETVDVVTAWLYESDIRDQEEWFEDAKERGYIRTNDGFFMHVDGAHFCIHCGEHSSEDTIDTVVLELSGTRISHSEGWCEGCRHDRATFCTVSERYYADSEFSFSLDDAGDTVCAGYVAAADWLWSDRTETWVHPDNWVSSIHDENYEEEEDDDEEEESESRVEIPQYHHAQRRWSLTIAKQSLRSFFGFELEVLFPSEPERMSFWKEHLMDDDEFCGEIDGSIDRDQGLEIITRPFSMHELQNKCRWEEMVALLRSVPVTTPQINYGLHITSNWQRLHSDHLMRAVRMVYDSKHTVKCLSRRINASYAPFIRSQFGLEHRIALAKRRDGSVELRTIQATTEWWRIMAGAEFMDAIVEWTQNPRNPYVAPFAGTAFRHWIKEVGNYPNLVRVFSIPQHHEATLACV